MTQADELIRQLNGLARKWYVQDSCNTGETGRDPRGYGSCANELKAVVQGWADEVELYEGELEYGVDLADGNRIYRLDEEVARGMAAALKSRGAKLVRRYYSPWQEVEDG